MNIRNRYLTRILATTATVGLAVGLSACTINIGTGYPNNDGNSHMDGDGMMNGSESSEFSSMDIMFAQMMIPHHQQAVEMSTLVLQTSTNTELRDLAQQILDAQSPEIEQMKGWLTAAGASEDMGHDMGMDGMLSDAEMAELESATGTDRDLLFLSGMIAHHEGALQMTHMIENSANAEAAALAEAIITGQTAEIAVMKQMLSELS
ncbi:MAG: DUF305 domain-containing protein [Microbacteriaceae bacterium]